jgi:hypothetical protein
VRTGLRSFSHSREKFPRDRFADLILLLKKFAFALARPIDCIVQLAA